MSDNNTTPETLAEHPFFRHNEKQTFEPISGKVVKGQIPAWLEGNLIRNGPGILKVGNSQYRHLFDGLAILHKFTIKNGEAYYQSRALESEAHKRNFEAGRIVVSEFGTTSFPDPCLSIFGKLQSKFTSLYQKPVMETTDNCSVNIGYYGDQLYAMTETAFVRRIDPETLKSIGDKTRIRDYCVMNGATAHPHCLEDGTMINVGTHYRDKKGPHYCFMKVPPSFGSDETAYKNAEIIARIPARWKMYPSYFHSFGMTKDKIIFIEYPLCISLPSIVTAPLFNKSIEECLTWYGSEKTRFHVLSMKDGSIHPVTYETDDLFTFHHINAYEENGFLIVDVAGYNDGAFLKHASTDYFGKSSPTIVGATPRRYVLPLNVEGAKAGENLVELLNTDAKAILRQGSQSIVDLTPHHMINEWLELSRINYNYNGKKYNYVYGIGSTDPDTEINIPRANKIIKVDITNGTSLSYISSEDMVSEPVFVPNPTNPSADEDDGVLLVVVLHKDPQVVSLVILNAKDMKEISQIQWKAHGTVTSTFHGLWTDQKKN